jgi:Leucine-rich repeat (LRR) protein
VLDLSRLGLTTLPDEVFWHSQFLHELDISWNAIPDLPAALLACSALRNLNMTMTGLATLPAVIPLLRSLEVLQLTDNKISKLPSSISSLCRLKLLVVSGNQLTELPNSISGVRPPLRLWHCISFPLDIYHFGIVCHGKEVCVSLPK